MTTVSKKRKIVSDGVFYAELNALFERELGVFGYSGVEVRVTPVRTEIIIRATKTQEVVGEKGRRIRELASLLKKRWNLETVDLYAERVPNRALCAIAQAESLKFKLLGGLAVRRACYGVLRFIMESGAKGCEIVISGKLRGQRAKAMKFRDGYMIKSGNAVEHYVDSSCRSILLKQGILGIKVTIMLPHDEEGKKGPKTSLSDVVIIKELEKTEDQPKQPAYGQAAMMGQGGGAPGAVPPPGAQASGQMMQQGPPPGHDAGRGQQSMHGQPHLGQQQGMGQGSYQF
jgi:small subunit ribosomal protein S3e